MFGMLTAAWAAESGVAPEDDDTDEGTIAGRIFLLADTPPPPPLPELEADMALPAPPCCCSPLPYTAFSEAKEDGVL